MAILMKKTYLLKVLPLALPLISACTSICHPEMEGDEVLAVNVLAEADSLVSASVSHSWYFASRPKDPSVSDADVTVSVNGEMRGKMTYDSASRRYLSDVRVKEGDKVEVSAMSAGYGSAKGSSVVPVKVKIDSWSMEYFLEKDNNTIIVNPDGSFHHPTAIRYDYYITFTDPADEENYYLLQVDGESVDPIFGENDSPLDAVFATNDEFMVFSDRSIAGKEYTLTCRLSSYGALWDTKMFFHRIGFYSISRDYYLYLLSIHKKYDGLNGTLEELGLAEPRSVYTNVSSGAGIVGAQSVDVIFNDVSEIAKNELGIERPK